MQELGIQTIAANSPQARGRNEGVFRTLQDRLPKELAAAGIETLETANRFLATTYLAEINRRFNVPAAEEGSTFVPLLGIVLDDILCLKAERTVNHDNCVSYGGKLLQIPKIKGRCHYVKAKVTVHEYANGQMTVFHGPRRIGQYDATGKLMAQAAGQDMEDAA